MAHLLTLLQEGYYCRE